MTRFRPIGRCPKRLHGRCGAPRIAVVLALSVVVAWSSAGTPRSRAAEVPDAGGELRALPIRRQSWQGDLPGMIERRLIRVLVPFSRTLYFNDKGRERGVTADLFRQFERWINQKFAATLGKRPITVALVPTTRDRVLEDVAGGFGDIAAGNLTVTEQRRSLVDFYVAPGQGDLTEVVVTGPASPVIDSVDDLSGKVVHVRKSSSYYESLAALNERFVQERKPPIELVLVPDALEDEDMMEMLAASILQVIIVDAWKATMWAPVLPGVRVHADAAVRTGGSTGWAIRHASPELEALLGEFFTTWVAKQGHQKDRSWSYAKRIQHLKNPQGHAAYDRFQRTIALFQTYGAKYRFEPLLLAAQGYQESQLDQNARSAVGAIGVMQLMPSTGSELNVGDIRLVEPNVHAGAKYMDRLMSRYFRDADLSDLDRCLFAFASYNAGPGNIAKMRKLAVQRGFDPDVWFDNVEIVTAERIGLETTTYVRNIYKYYVAYALLRDLEEAGARARETMQPAELEPTHPGGASHSTPASPAHSPGA